MINKAYTSSKGVFYYDVASNTTMYSKDEVSSWYGRSMEMWDINNGEHPPFNLIRN